MIGFEHIEPIVNADAPTELMEAGRRTSKLLPLFGWRALARTEMEAHVGGSPIEVAGLLVGRRFESDGRVLVAIEHAVPAHYGVETSSVHVSFRAEAWDHLSPAISALGTDIVIVGWYHSHPGLGAFFSGTDRRTQSSYFQRPWQIGVVIDPKRKEERYFIGPNSEEVGTQSFVQIAGDTTRARRAEAPRRPGGARRAGAKWIAVAVGLGLGLAYLARRRARSVPQTEPDALPPGG